MDGNDPGNRASKKKGRKRKHRRPPGKGTNPKPGARSPVSPLTGWYGPVVAGVALLARLVALLQTRGTPVAEHLSTDARFYLLQGEQLRQGGFFSGEAFSMNPLYTVIVGWLVPLIDVSGMRLLQVLLGALTAWLIFRVGARVFDPTVGLIAGIAYACHPVAILYTLTLLPTTVAVAGAALAIWLALRTGGEGKALPAAGVGLILGLTTLVRPNLLIWVPVFLAWFLVFTPRRFRLRVLVCYLVAVTLPVALTTARNAAVSGEPVLISSNGGVNFYLGNHLDAPGHFFVPSELLAEGVGMMEASNRIAERASGAELGPSAVSRFWFGKGMNYLAANPVQAAGLWLRKMLLQFNARDYYINEGPVEYAVFCRLFRAPSLWMGIIAPFGLAGLFFSVGAGNRSGKWLLYGLLLAQVTALVLFFVSARHRMPGTLVLLPFAGLALRRLYSALRCADRRWLLRGGASIAGAAVLCWLPLVPQAPHLGYARLGSLYIESDKPVQAEASLRKAIALDSECDIAFFQLGGVLRRLGRVDEAISAYKRANDLRPGDSDTLLNLGSVYREAGRPQEAEKTYLDLIAAQPDFIPAHFNLAILYYRSGQLGGACSHLEEALRLDPDFAPAHLRLAVLLMEDAERRQEAAMHFRAYLNLEPGGPYASMARQELMKITPRK